jgi:hypothetical protein
MIYRGHKSRGGMEKMVKRKGWSYSEERLLIENYHEKTIKELETMFPDRPRESINNKIKRLKKAGKIKGGKEEVTIHRSYMQRGVEEIN